MYMCMSCAVRGYIYIDSDEAKEAGFFKLAISRTRPARLKRQQVAYAAPKQQGSISLLFHWQRVQNEGTPVHRWRFMLTDSGAHRSFNYKNSRQLDERGYFPGENFLWYNNVDTQQTER